MRKRLLLLTLCLCLIAPSALAWTCPGCGVEAEYNFCIMCGAKRPVTICPTCTMNYGDAIYRYCVMCGTELNPATQPTPTVAPTAAPTATLEPTATPTLEPTATPEPTASPTAAPTATPAPTAAPTATPEPTAVPAPGTTLVQATIPGLPQGATPISISPDGQVVICMYNGYPAVVEHGALRYIIPSTSRGVADINRNLERIASLSNPLGLEGIPWSTDGRYAVLTNRQRVLAMADFSYDPIVLDTATGELFLLATTGNRPFKGPTAAVLSAAFALDGHTLYTTEFGNIDGKRCAIRAYDVDSLKYQTLLLSGEYLGTAGLYVLPDGSLLTSDSPQERTAEGFSIVHVNARNGQWQYKKYRLASHLPSLRELNYSAKSGYGLGYVSAALESPQAEGVSNVVSFLTCFQPAQQFAGLEHFWQIPSLDADAAVAFTGKEIENYLATEVIGADNSPVAIQQTVLSSDGQQALLLCSQSSDTALLLLNLADMTLTRLTGLAEDDLATLMKPNRYLSWQGEYILMGVSPMEAFAFQIK